MKRLLVALLTMTLLAAGVPLGDAQEGGITTEPLPFSPETATFFIYGTPDPSAANAGCGQSIGAAHGDSNWVGPFGSNNPAEPCARGDQPTQSTANYRKAAPSYGVFEVRMVPEFREGTPFDTEQTISGEFTLIFEALQEAAPHVGAVKPLVQFMIGDSVVAEWDGAGEPLDSIEGPTTGGVFVKYTFDMGAPPEKVAATGGAKLVVDIRNDAAAQSLRTIAQRVAIAVDAGHRGFVNIPFAAGADQFGPGDDDDNETGANNTTTEPSPTPTPTPDNNTTVPEPTNTTAANNTTAPPSPDESGFLPGFEVAALVSAALIALAFVVRGRRRT